MQDKQIKLLLDLINELKIKNSKLFKTQTHCVWPHSTSKGNPRTKEEILAIVEAIKNEGISNFSADELKGIVGESLFLNVPGFDFVLAIPTEYMHLGCLGVVKRCLLLTKHKIILIYVKHTLS